MNKSTHTSLRICWFGIYNRAYSRNYVLLEGLQECGVTVVACHVPSDVWFPFKYLKLMYKLILLRREFDIVYVAFPAQMAVLAARLCTTKPVVMDAFYSMYENIVHDRQSYSWFHPFALIMGFLDWVSTRVATMVIVDTSAHKEYWSTWWGIKAKKIHVVPVGSSTHHFFPIDQNTSHADLLVHFHGTYIPLQGVDVIIEAAALLRDEANIRFRLIGDGQTYTAVRARAARHALTNVEFIERVSLKKLNQYMHEADVVLGIFGSTDKADRVVPNKVYEGLATRKPVITKNTRAVREILADTEVFVTTSEPQAVAAAIKSMQDNTLRHRYAQAGYQAFTHRFTQKVIARQLYTHIETFATT